MDSLIKALQQHPELAIFLTLAVGYLLGRIKFGSFAIGTVTGVLIAGVLIGQAKIVVSPNVKAVFFLLFLFSIGYKVGPQFFGGLKKNGLPQAGLTIVLCVTALLSAFVAAKLLHYNQGMAAGLLGGAITESAVLGTAGDAINRLSIADADKTAMLDQMAIAFAVTYLLGTISVAWFLPVIGPKLMRVNLKEECKKLELEMAGGVAHYAPGVVSAHRAWDLRAYRINGNGVAGQTAAEFEKPFLSQKHRVFIQRVRHESAVQDPTPETVLHDGDVVAVIARREVLLQKDFPLRDEVEDKELLDFPAEALDIVVTNKQFAGKTLAEIATLTEEGEHLGHGVILRKLVRNGTELPFTPATDLNRGDTLKVAGAVRDVERAAKRLGYASRPTSATNMVLVGLGVFVGGLIGLLELVVHGIPVGLGTSGGVLLAGLILGWARSAYPVFGGIPEEALWIFDSLGLNAFIAVVGLGAGPTFFSGLKQAGPSLVIACVAIAWLSHTVTILVGRYLMKMHPGIVLGVCSGAGTATPSLLAIQEAADSKIPALGYGLPYALGNVLLIVWGTVIVAMLN
jgi:putative transport protein